MATYSFPIDFHQTLSWKVRNFPDSTYTFNVGDHLTNLMNTLLGESGTGQLSTIQTTARINEQINGMEFSDLDYILGSLLTVSRLSGEQYPVTVNNPFLEQIPLGNWQNVNSSDSSYRERLKASLQAVDNGATVLGMVSMAEAISGVPCELVETWRVPSVSRFTHPSQYEFVIYPKIASDDNVFTTEVRAAVYEVLQTLKPVGTIATIEAGLVVHELVSTRTGSASSEWFELQRTVVGTNLGPIPSNVSSNITVPGTFVSNTVGGSQYWLTNSTPTLAPTTAHSTTQEAVIDITPMIDQVQAFVFSESGGQQVPNSMVPLASIVWGPWVSLGLGDSPDNFPNGKYPASQSNRDISGNYIFPFSSQEDYIHYETSLIKDVGGQVVGNLYRLPESTPSSPSSQGSLLGICRNKPSRLKSSVYGGV